MKLEYVSLFQNQRELQGMPRNYDRFREYLRTIFGEGETLELPSLLYMNPMGKEHVTALVDSLIAMDADAIAARAVAEAAKQVEDVEGEFKITLVVSDDLLGGWTNRYDYEFKLRFPDDPPTNWVNKRPRWLNDLWLTGILWSSEPASERAVREAVLTNIYRCAYVARHGRARSLRAMLVQEGRVMAAAGCEAPALEADDIEYTREVLAPFLNSDDRRTCMECLFGDAAGATLGFTPRGLSHWAGLALALHDARREMAGAAAAVG